MTPADAVELWGAEVVSAALAARPDPMPDDLLAEVREHAARMTDSEFREWALTRPWPRFCAVVRLVSGVTRAELLTKGNTCE
ncbi:MAG: hypothetical protein KKI08_25650 [Armatimonadetes bacterium]|nr:hypothetical protein [Armatimonadota bacterium]